MESSCLSVCLLLCFMSVCVSPFMSLCLSLCLLVYLFICVSSPVCLPLLFFCLFACLSISVSLTLSYSLSSPYHSLPPTPTHSSLPLPPIACPRAMIIPLLSVISFLPERRAVQGPETKLLLNGSLFESEPLVLRPSFGRCFLDDAERT